MVDHMLESLTAGLLAHVDVGINLTSNDPTYSRQKSAANATSPNR